MDGWIVIPNWRRFQHYKKRNPIWIKVYTELMSDPAFLGLTFAQRGLLISLWLEYANSRQRVPEESSEISRMLGRKVRKDSLEALNDAGFIEVSASKTGDKRYQNASPELLRNSKRGDARRRSGKRAASPQKELLAAAERFVADWHGTDSDAFEEALDELEQLAGARFAAGTRYDLWDRAISQEQMH